MNKKEHDLFRGRSQQIMEMLGSGGATKIEFAPLEIELNDWVVDHITFADTNVRRFAPLNSEKPGSLEKRYKFTLYMPMLDVSAGKFSVT